MDITDMRSYLAQERTGLDNKVAPLPSNRMVLPISTNDNYNINNTSRTQLYGANLVQKALPPNRCSGWSIETWVEYDSLVRFTSLRTASCRTGDP